MCFAELEMQILRQGTSFPLESKLPPPKCKVADLGDAEPRFGVVLE